MCQAVCGWGERRGARWLPEASNSGLRSCVAKHTFMYWICLFVQFSSFTFTSILACVTMVKVTARLNIAKTQTKSILYMYMCTNIHMHIYIPSDC